jgi:hypothetical protein
MMPRGRKSLAVVACLSTVLLAGCDPLSMTLMGVLSRMSIKVESTRKEDRSEVILAKTTDRDIEVELEEISPRATRVRSIARHGVVLMDAATANEIIVQTGRALGGA